MRRWRWLTLLPSLWCPSRSRMVRTARRKDLCWRWCTDTHRAILPEGEAGQEEGSMELGALWEVWWFCFIFWFLHVNGTLFASFCRVLMLYPTDVSLKSNVMFLYGRREVHLGSRKIIALSWHGLSFKQRDVWFSNENQNISNDLFFIQCMYRWIITLYVFVSWILKS